MCTSIYSVVLILSLNCAQCTKNFLHGNRVFRSFRSGDVILGGLFDVHTSGNNSETCGDVLPASLGYTEAMVFAIDSINRNKTLLPNITLGFDIRDYCLRPENAVMASYELVIMSDDRFTKRTSQSAGGGNDSNALITAVIGPVDSTSATIVSNLFEMVHIPCVSSLASSLELTSTLYDHFYRTVAPDKWRASLLADMAEFFNWSYVAAVALDDSFGRYGIWGIEREAYERGDFCIAMSEFVPRVDFFDAVKRIVSNLKSLENVKVVFVWLYGEYARSFMTEAREQNLTGRTWIFTDGATPRDPFFVDDPRFDDIIDGALGILPKAEVSLPFEEHIANQRSKNFTNSALPWWREYWNSIKEHPEMSVESFLTAFASPYISFTIDAVYTVAHALSNMNACVEPGLLADGKCPSVRDKINGEDLHTYIKNVSFQGFTGKVKFDEYGDPFEARYDVFNIRRGSKEIYVGFWDKNNSPKLSLNVSLITWNRRNRFSGVPLSVCSEDCKPGERKISKSSCCWECTLCPSGTISTEGKSSNCTECPENQKPNEQRTKCIALPEKRLTWTNFAVAVAAVLSVAGFLLTLMCFAVFVKYRNSAIVKASNKELSFVLMAAVGSFFVLAFLYLLTPSDGLCIARHCWRHLVYTACVSILLLKSRKILKAFQFRARHKVASNSTSRKKPKCFPKQPQGLQLAVLLSVVATLIISWRIFDPPTKARITRPLQYIFTVCKPFCTNAGRNLLVVIAGYVISLSFVCIYYAFKARKIPENFNEAKFIGFSMYVLLLSLVAYYPVELALDVWYVGVVSSLVTLASSFSLLGCMFGPKLYVILFYPSRNTREAMSTDISNYSFTTSAAITSVSRVVPMTTNANTLD